VGQFTDTEFPLATQQHQYAQAGEVTQGFEELVSFHNKVTRC